MRICIIGDLHIRFQLPYAAAIEDGRRGEWEAVKSKIIETAKNCDAHVFLGDNLNARHNHSSVNREFVEFINRDNFRGHRYIISGNHETFGKDTAIDFLKKSDIAGLHVYTKIERDTLITSLGTLDVTFLPYMTPGLLNAENLEDAQQKVLEQLPGGDVLFHHHAVSGVKTNDQSIEFLNEIVLPREELEKKYKWIIGGHIHQKQWLSDKTLVAGSIFSQNAGDHAKSVFVLDTDKNEVEEIPLPVRGIYRVVNPSPEALRAIPDYSIVKVIITSLDTQIDDLRASMERFDSSIVVEQYPNKRKRIIFDEAGALDFSIDNLIRLYSKERNISHEDLKEAFELLEQ